MPRDAMTLLVAGLSALIVLVAFGAYVLRPALTVHETWWQRALAAVLAVQVLVAFVVVGLYLGLVAIDRWVG